LRQDGRRHMIQALIQWSNSTTQEATREDLDSLCQSFPRAPAWGQAVSEEGGRVSSLHGGVPDSMPAEEKTRPNQKPTRTKRLPAGLQADYGIRVCNNIFQDLA
jgi:hypothetical protein